MKRDEVRELDRRAVEEYGMPSVVLMENAGHGLCRLVLREAALRRLEPPLRVAIVCGRGNNGGDGLVLARHLYNRGHLPELLLAFDPAKARRDGDAGVNLTICERMGLPMTRVEDGEPLGRLLAEGGYALAADALLGTGLRGEVREPYRGLVEALNRATTPVVAVDIPSGLDADRGAPLGVAVEACLTVTFAAPKAGFFAPGARRYTGRLQVVDIGVPRELGE